MTRSTCDTVGTKIRQFNDFIRGELKRKRKTQADLAEYLGIERSTLTYRLNGDSAWPFKDALKVLEFFDTTLEKI